MLNLVNDNRKADLLKAAEKYGEAEGAGGNSRPDLAMRVTADAYEGAITTAADANKKPSTDIDDVWDRFQAGRAKRAGKTRVGKESSFKVQVSKLGNFAKVGELARAKGFDALDVMTRARAVIDDCEDAKGSTFDNLVKVARVQLSNEQGGTPMTDGEILQAITPSEPELKTELQLLDALLKSAVKIHDGTKPSEDGSKPGKPGNPSDELAEVVTILTAKVGALQLIVERADLAKRQAEFNAKHSRLIPAVPTYAPGEQIAA